MSAITPTPISERIINPLRQVSQRQWTVLAARGVLQTLVISLAVLLASALVLGYLPGIWMPVRVLLALLAWGTVAWAAIRSLRPALQRWTLSHAAQFAEQSLPENHERISSAVELSDTSDEFRGSPELVAHLVRQAEQDAGRVNAVQIVPFNTIFLWAIIFLPVLALWMFFAFNSRTAQPVMRGLFSTLMPWKNELPPLLSDIQVKPGNVTLAQGDTLDVLAKVSATLAGKDMAAGRVALVRKFDSGQSVNQALDQTAAREFHASLENLQQSFQYKITTDQAQSEWFTATVRPRPGITRLDLHLDYPKYSGIEPRDITAGDGNVEALTGTHVTLTLHTTDALVTDKSQLLFDEGKPTQSVVTLTQTEKNTYQAKFDVAHDSAYQVKLLNEYALGNKDGQARVVTAQPDEPPVIVITSPTSDVTVRPDDDVPVMFVAGDDYGVAHIEALVQVDDQAEQSLPVAIRAKDHRDIKGQWVLSVPSLLAQVSGHEGKRITYQLKATDNRDPDPQTGLSTKQTLLISRQENRSYAQKLNQKRKEDLQSAIRKAIDRLNQNEGRVAQLQWREPNKSLDVEGLRQAAESRDSLTTTSKDLSTAANDYLQTPYAQVAQAAKDIADKTITASADDVARTALDADAFPARKADAEKSHKELIEARTGLEKLIEKTEQAQRKAEAAEELKQAAKEQQEVAKQMREHPENADQNRQKQQEAMNKLQEAIQKDQALQDPKAQQLAQKLAELENKIEQNEQKQTDLQNNTSKQEEMQQAQQQANALAEEQKKLNEQVQEFAKKDKDPLQQASAQTPNSDQQKDLVKNIEKNQIQPAAEQARQQAEQLKQDAQKLADQAKNPNLSETQKKQDQQDKQNQQDAQNAQNDANKAADALKNQAAKDQKDPNAQQANKDAADQAQKAAEQVRKEADAVEKQNEQGARNADVQKAAELAKTDAMQAAKDAQAAAQAQDPQAAQKDLDQAGKELAQAGQELNQAAQAEAKADQAMAQQQNQAAAQDAAQQAQGLADQQQQIADALQKQAEQAADAQGATPPQQAADQQQQLARQTQQAQEAAKQLAQQAQNQKDTPLAQRAQQAADALAQAAQSQQEAAKAEAQKDTDQAGQAQADAQQALAQADQALRGNPEQAQADTSQGQPEQGQPEQGQGTPEQTAGQAAQEAAQAQQQSRDQQNQPAAAEAAHALAQASHAAEQGLPGQGDPEQGQGDEQGNEPGQEMANGNETANHPGRGSQPKEGITGSETGGNNQVPVGVQALGISAGDWAKLPPMMQKELQNASQQSGPPAYREMIKNYYVRVARMQSARPDAPRKQ